MKPYLLLLLLMGCSGEPHAPRPEGEPPIPAYAMFNPDTVAAGDSILGLRVASTDFRRAFEDSVWVGGAAFEGEISVSGLYAAHFDCEGDPLACIPCFYADSTSSLRLPRMVGDERYVWFCFNNPSEVEQALGEPLPGGRDGFGRLTGGRPANIVIENYRYIVEYSDVFNSADFVSHSP